MKKKRIELKEDKLSGKIINVIKASLAHELVYIEGLPVSFVWQFAMDNQKRANCNIIFELHDRFGRFGDSNYNDTRAKLMSSLTTHFSKYQREMLADSTLLSDILDGSELVNNRGKITKRIKNNVKKITGLKISDEFIQEVGNYIYHNHNNGTYFLELISGYDIEIARPIFGDAGSCFWGCNEHHRLTIANNDHVFSMLRIYNDKGEPLSRCFVYHDHDGYFPFNAYGPLNLKKQSELLKMYLEDCNLRMSKIDMSLDDIWLNNSVTYALLKHGVTISRKYCSDYETEYGHTCELCSSGVGEDDYYYVSEMVICPDCYSDNCFFCSDCNEDHFNENGQWIESINEMICDNCLENGNYAFCSSCLEYSELDDCYVTKDGDVYCIQCGEDELSYCEECGEYNLTEDGQDDQLGDWYCYDCKHELLHECKHCNEYYHEDNSDSAYLCDDCLDDALDDSQLSLPVGKFSNVETFLLHTALTDEIRAILALQVDILTVVMNLVISGKIWQLDVFHAHRVKFEEIEREIRNE